MPSNEAARVRAVRRYDILDTPPDGTFDRITNLAARLLDVPIAIVSIVDSDRIWFKSHYGLDIDEIPRDPGLCASAILFDTPWVVSDAAHDPRTLANPLVCSEFGLRFYAGVPLTTIDGFNLGMLCVIDKQPRTIDDASMATLHDLAAIVMDEMELRLASRRAISLERTVRDKERKRVARELHDDLGQLLAALRMDLSLLQRQTRRTGLSGQTLAKMDQLLVSSIDSLRRIATDLRPKALDEGGLYFALHAMLERFSARYGIAYTLQADESALEMDDACTTAIFRIIQEALNNIVQHAHAENVRIEFIRRTNQLHIRIEDDGCGISPTDLQKDHAFGLVGMRERVRGMNGTMTVTGRDRRGTTIEVALPIAKTREISP